MHFGTIKLIFVSFHFGFIHFKSKCQNNAIYKIKIRHNQSSIYYTDIGDLLLINLNR